MFMFHPLLPSPVYDIQIPILSSTRLRLPHFQFLIHHHHPPPAPHLKCFYLLCNTLVNGPRHNSVLHTKLFRKLHTKVFRLCLLILRDIKFCLSVEHYTINLILCLMSSVYFSIWCSCTSKLFEGFQLSYIHSVYKFFQDTHRMCTRFFCFTMSRRNIRLLIVGLSDTITKTISGIRPKFLYIVIVFKYYRLFIRNPYVLDVRNTNEE